MCNWTNIFHLSPGRLTRVYFPLGRKVGSSGPPKSLAKEVARWRPRCGSVDVDERSLRYRSLPRTCPRPQARHRRTGSSSTHAVCNSAQYQLGHITRLLAYWHSHSSQALRRRSHSTYQRRTWNLNYNIILKCQTVEDRSRWEFHIEIRTHEYSFVLSYHYIKLSDHLTI